MSNNYCQLILFDCDGGRSSLFDDLTIVKQILSNCQFYLFWNRNDSQITANLNRLTANEQIHLYPTILINSKNSADAKLIYILGKLVKDFSFIQIIHGNDSIYSEIVHTVISEFNPEKIEETKIDRSPNSETLKQLIEQCQQRNQQNHYLDSKQVHTSTTNPSLDFNLIINDYGCIRCTKRFKQFLSLYAHITSKHQLSPSIICQCSLEFDKPKDYNRHRKSLTKSIKNIINCCQMESTTSLYFKADSPPLLLLSSKSNKCPFNCRQRLFMPSGLIAHLQFKHNNEINIQIQCCNPNIKYTFKEFHDHILSQHNILKIQ